MASFNFIIVAIAAVILIITLSYMAVNMSSSSSTTVFPPTHNDCPDGWIMNSAGKCIAPTNGNIGSPPITATTKYVTADAANIMSISPHDTAWTASTGLTDICSKQQWSTANNISWDGVSNYNSC